MAERGWAIPPKTFAKRYGFKLDTVYGWIHNGKLTALRTPGGDYRITPEDLADFNRRCRDQDSPNPATGSENEPTASSPSAGPISNVAKLPPFQQGKEKKRQRGSGRTSS